MSEATMRESRVPKEGLLKKIKENRRKHVEEYEESVQGYKEAALQAIDEATQQLKRRVGELKEGQVVRLHAVQFNLQVPENHSKDYDRAIAMLEMSIDNEITIKADEFSRYVMDDWEWKEDFRNVQATYAGFANKKFT